MRLASQCFLLLSIIPLAVRAPQAAVAIFLIGLACHFVIFPMLEWNTGLNLFLPYLLGAGVLIGATLRVFYCRKGAALFRRSYLLLLLAFLWSAYLTLNTLYHWLYHWEGLRLSLFSDLFFLVLLPAIACLLTDERDERNMRTAATVMLALAGCIGLGFLWMFTSGTERFLRQWHVGDQLSVVSGYAQAGMFCAAALVVAWLYRDALVRHLGAAIYSCLLAGAIAGTILPGARQAWLAAGLGLGVGFLRDRTLDIRRSVLLVSLILATICGVTFYSMPAAAKQVVAIVIAGFDRAGEQAGNLAGRWQQWNLLITEIGGLSITGEGLGAFPSATAQRMNQVTVVSKLPAADSSYVQVVVLTGWLGVLLVGGWVLAMLACWQRYARGTQPRERTVALALSAGLLGSGIFGVSIYSAAFAFLTYMAVWHVVSQGYIKVVMGSTE